MRIKFRYAYSMDYREGFVICYPVMDHRPTEYHPNTYTTVNIEDFDLWRHDDDNLIRIPLRFISSDESVYYNAPDDMFDEEDDEINSFGSSEMHSIEIYYDHDNLVFTPETQDWDSDDQLELIEYINNRKLTDDIASELSSIFD